MSSRARIKCRLCLGIVGTLMVVSKKIIEFTRQYIGDLDEEICSQQQTQFKTDAQLIKEYWLKSKEAGHWLSGYEVGHNSDLANDVTYYNRFGGMKNTRNLAISLFGDFTETN